VTDFPRLLGVLVEGDVEFVIIGGLAATLHGSAHATVDLDIVYRRSPENITRLASAVAPLAPALRGAPEGLPFRFDAPTIQMGMNFTLVTSAGYLDVLGEATGGGTYEALLPLSEPRELFGLHALCVDLDTLIRLKRAAGRPKDLERIAELEAIREEREEQ
jgi:hypothetical protein